MNHKLSLLFHLFHKAPRCSDCHQLGHWMPIYGIFYCRRCDDIITLHFSDILQLVWR